MTFKLFRRGSARCIGLLSAFVTILLCLYYISIGQPTTTPTGAQQKDALMGGGAMHLPLQKQQQQQQYFNKIYAQKFKSNEAAAAAGAGSAGGAPTKQHETQHHAPQQPPHKGSGGGGGAHDEAANDFSSNNKDEEDAPRGSGGGSAAAEGATSARGVDSAGSGGTAFVSNAHWGDVCYRLDERPTNITAGDEYGKFDFQPEWIRTKEYWDRGFEERFETQKTEKERPPLKVFIVPHSHNDPGWLKTFVNYFQSDTRQILNLMVTKMQEFKDMTFIWSEISFLQLWWDQAHPTKQRALRRLINSGRIEITTGGWVMTDEANVHLYAMLDQLIEGHQWLRNNLNVTPTVGWSIDPFGHGSTVPYLLSGAKFEGAIIQRIHYAWKQWFARQQKGDFLWSPYWQQQQQGQEPAGVGEEHGSLLTHNMPFDIYSIKHSCGPHPFICLNFDFRKIPGEYTEYSVKAQFITNENIQEKALLLLEQYARTASLFPHNVALIPVGDDFRYNKEREVVQQYTNYKKLIDHIMANKQTYNVDISFGTPRDYFREIRKRSAAFPTFKGDFFVYSDIFSEGRPAYWSGYFTTRPFYKILSADLEHNLRAAEILFTIAYNTARQLRHENAIKIFEKNYEKMINARRNLGLFQHHDAITGTSKAAVMRDYGMRLFESIQDVVKMQESSIELLLQSDSGGTRHNFLLSELERDNFTKLPRKTPIPLPLVGGAAGESPEYNAVNVGTETGNGNGGAANGAAAGGNKPKAASFVVFNALAQKRLEIVALRTPVPNVKILNERGEPVRQMQVNPVWNITDTYEPYGTPGNIERLRVSARVFEVIFLAELEPLSLTTYQVVVDEDEGHYKHSLATIYCDDCTDTPTATLAASATTNTAADEFVVKAKPAGAIQLENNHMRLLFDEKSGFLKTLTRKHNEQLLKPMPCAVKFAAYRSAQFHSGAYLFKTDPEQTEAEKDVLEQYEDVRIIITTGPIASDVSVIYGPFLAHTMRIFHTRTPLDAAVYIENDIDFEPPPKNRETELFMRFITDIDNIANAPHDVLKEGESAAELPVFYSDQNGFQYHKRVKVPSIGVEGNYFPITTGTFMQDSRVRFTLLTTHAQGAASLEPGQLEVMLDRRTLYDDYRGMGEGVVDSRLTRHKFWLLVEDMPSPTAKNKNTYQVPSLLANQLANALRYPTNVYYIEALDVTEMQLKTKALLLDHGPLPCDVHLTTFRTLSEEQLQLFPSSSALLVLHRQGYDCAVGGQPIDLASVCPAGTQGGLGNVQFNRLRLQRLETTSLTGMSSAHERRRISTLADVALKPMDLRTFNVTFRA